MIAMSEHDKLFCQWLHNAIPDRAPTVLTLFNNSAFEHDSYLELRYRIEDPIAHLYFCGNGLDKVRNDDFFHFVTKNHRVPQYTDIQSLLDSCNPYCYLSSARICDEKLSYILSILYECQGTHLEQNTLGRDGNFVTLKSFWYSGAEFSYWVSPKNVNTRIEELVWLLADYLPRPARNALQPILQAETLQILQHLS